MTNGPKKPSVAKILGWILLVGTIGVVSCQAFLAEPDDVRPASPPTQQQQSR
ncbi:MAG: hypothetical protein IPM60_04340 [Rhodospirillales bacterium]|nr:hypothetical protein [Rhodospirillales bacterium]